MIEEEPVISADEVGMVEDSPGGVQAGAGSWTLPEAGSITSCPKCGPVIATGSVSEDDDSFGMLRAHVNFHKTQHPYAPDIPDDQQSPCVFLDPVIFPKHVNVGAIVGGQHVCVRCLRCKYGWVERVARPESIYISRQVEE
jgi:hypothetical protein